jgi:excinuclease ABC subunit C
MKDDKNFVYLKITKNEDYPRVEIVRKVEKDGAKYIGPKTASYKLENTLKMLQKIFNFRSCNLGIEFVNIGEAKITNKTIAYPCLDYHIKRCEAPCIGKVTPEEYAQNIKQIENFFEGKSEEIVQKLTADMDNFAREKNFEMAVKIRDKLFTIRDLQQKQIVTSPDHRNADVFAFVIENEKAYMNLFLIRDGKLLDQSNFIIDALGFESSQLDEASEIMESFLFQYYQKTSDYPEEIIVPVDFSESELFEQWIRNQAGRKVKILFPQKGKKYQLLELALKNAESFKKQNKARWEVAEEKDINALKELQKILGLEKLPKRMECYDISHLSGTNTVASMVVFENGKAKNSDYRKFRIRELEHGQIDDFKSMAEVLGRRLSKLAKGSSEIKIKKANKSSVKDIDKLFVENGSKAMGEYKGFYLAHVKGKIAGRIRVSEYNKVFLLESFYVGEKYRSKGVGASLLSTRLINTIESI